MSVFIIVFLQRTICDLSFWNYKDTDMYDMRYLLKMVVYFGIIILQKNVE